MKRFLLSIMTAERNDWLAWIIRVPLYIASLVYGLIVRFVLFLYSSAYLKRSRLDVPVISIGNLTVGGVGKTPMAIYLAKMLISKRFKPVILTRGYMPKSSLKVQESKSDEVEFMREALINVPIVVDSDRYQGGLEAIEKYNPNVFILDDGFQHWKLYRDFEIVLVDTVNPFGNRQLLPCGILREPLSSLNRADIIVLTKTDLGDARALKIFLSQHCPNVPIVETVHRARSLMKVFTKEIVNVEKVKTSVVAFCAIGDPNSFKSMLIDLGADVKECVHFLDHHTYSVSDMESLRDSCLELGVRTLVTTRKDAVKLSEYQDIWQGFDLYALNIEVEIIQGQEYLINGIHRLSHR